MWFSASKGVIVVDQNTRTDVFVNHSIVPSDTDETEAIKEAENPASSVRKVDSENLIAGVNIDSKDLVRSEEKFNAESEILVFSEFEETKPEQKPGKNEKLLAQYNAQRELYEQGQRDGFRQYLQSTYGLPVAIKSKEELSWYIQDLDEKRLKRLIDEFGDKHGSSISKPIDQELKTDVALQRYEAYLQQQKRKQIHELVEVLSKRASIENNKK